MASKRYVVFGLSIINVVPGPGNQVTREHGRLIVASRDRHLDVIANAMSNERVCPLGSGTECDVLNAPWWYL